MKYSIQDCLSYVQRAWPSLLSLIFHIFIVAVIYNSYVPLSLKAHPALVKSLLSGSNRGYIVPGSGLAPLKNMLAGGNSFSLIMDTPFGENPENEKFFHDARNFLAPILLNPEPVERAAIVYCSTQAIAEQRLNETGYRWVGNDLQGKGLALKQA